MLIRTFSPKGEGSFGILKEIIWKNMFLCVSCGR